MRRVVVAGAGLAGSRCAETLRSHGFDGSLTLIGDENVPPYERPALSKEFLRGDKSAESLQLRPRTFWEEQGIELLLGRRVTEARDGVARTADGLELEWDALVIATGARPRSLPFSAPRGVHVLRTLADADALRLKLRPGIRLAVIGAGFVGAEVASTARELGVEVTVVEAGSAPLGALLGDEVGALLARRFNDSGVDLRTSCGVTGVGADARGCANRVLLADGSDLACDLVLVAVGVEPSRPCSEQLPGVHVCGDAAGGAGHWTSAAAGAAAVACTLLGMEPAPRQPPYVWSDQFGLRLQLVGDPREAALVDLDGREDDFVARYYDEHGLVVAALAANRPHAIAPLRRELALAA